MNALEKTAESISQHLNHVSDEDFLALYKSVATNEGVKINDYLNCGYAKEYLAACVFSIYSSDVRYKATVIDEIKGELASANFHLYAANDDNESLAA